MTRDSTSSVKKASAVTNLQINTVLPSEMRREAREYKEVFHLTYRIDGASLIVTSTEDGEEVRPYRIEGDTVTVGSAGLPEVTLRRVPDDS